jgi:hypothetical protein
MGLMRIKRLSSFEQTTESRNEVRAGRLFSCNVRSLKEARMQVQRVAPDIPANLVSQ